MRLWEQSVGGVAFLMAEACEPKNFWQRRRLFHILKKMRRSGVRQVARQGHVPEGLPEQFGFFTVDVSPLRQALLPQLLDWAEKAWELPLTRGCVRLHAVRTDRAVWQCAAVLARRVRYVELDAGEGAEPLAEELRRRYGLSCGGRAILELCLAPRSRGDVPALQLGRNCGRRQKMQWYTETLGELPEEVLTVLYEAGRVKAKAVKLRAVEAHA